jgi:chromosome segregation ATPase
MESNAGRLHKLNEEVTKQLDSVKTRLSEARKRFEAEESTALIEDRAPDPKLDKKVAELEAALAQVTSSRKAIARTIEELRDREIAERAQRAYEQRESFRKTAQPEIGRLVRATFEMRNAVDAFFEVYTKQGIGLVDLAGFLFPPEDPQRPLDDMARRMNQIGLMNTAMAWIKDDYQHSNTGPQKPKGIE